MSPNEIAYAVLEHFAIIAPYGSYNLALTSSNIEKLKKKIDEYNIKIERSRDYEKNPPVSAIEKGEFEQLKKEIVAAQRAITVWAFLNGIKIDLSKNTTEQINNISPINYRSPKYLPWYTQAMEKEKDFFTFKKKFEDEQKKYDDYIKEYKIKSDNKRQFELICPFLLNSHVEYQTIVSSQTSQCEGFANAAIDYLITQTAYNGNIFRLNGVNLDHTFIVINCDEVPNGNFGLEALPSDAIIIDPWLRCKFTADHAQAYYSGLDAFHKGSDENTKLVFTTRIVLSADLIQEARNFFKGLDEYLALPQPNKNSPS